MGNTRTTCSRCRKDIKDDTIKSCVPGYIAFPDGDSLNRETYSKDEKERCPVCNVVPGGYHHSGCYRERCPKCGKLLESCGCGANKK